MLDSQTVKSPHAAVDGAYNAAKRSNGRKRHIEIDTKCRLLMVNPAPAHVQDAAGAEPIVKTVRKRWRWHMQQFAEGGYDRNKLMNTVAYQSFVIKVVCKLASQQDLQVLLRRWMVERTSVG